MLPVSILRTMPRLFPSRKPSAINRRLTPRQPSPVSRGCQRRRSLAQANNRFVPHFMVRSSSAKMNSGVKRLKRSLRDFLGNGLVNFFQDLQGMFPVAAAAIQAAIISIRLAELLNKEL